MNGNNRWFKIRDPRKSAKIRLFLLPYAGGVASMFDGWENMIDHQIECVSIQLPGRGSRFNELLYTDITDLVKDLGSAIKEQLTLPYAVFGHSLGGLVGFELVRYCKKEYKKEAKHLFVAGSNAPQSRDKEETPKYLLPDYEFMDELRLKGEIDEKIINDKEIMTLLLPMIRADFQMNETYVYQQDNLLNCPISVYWGIADEDIKKEIVQSWACETKGQVSSRVFPGGHFFVNQQKEEICRAILRDLMADK